MDHRLEARRLRYFMQVLASGSVRGAAATLSMDASAVSRAISQLEQECGVPLLERRGRGVAPTEAGELLAGYLHRQQSEKQNMLAQIDSIRNVKTGHVNLAAGEGFVGWLMRNCLGDFMREHPKVTVNFDIASTNEIVESVMDGRAHIGLLFRPPNDERLLSHHSIPNPIRAWVLKGHPLTELPRPLKLSDLVPFQGATLHRSYGVRQHVEAAEVGESLRLNFALTTASFEAISHFVASGLGYALTPELILTPDDAERCVAIPIKSALLNRGRSHIVTCQGRLLPPAAQALLATVVRQMKATLPSRRRADDL